jgi:hypothetical protein
MGRQTLIHMLPEDTDALLAFVQQQDPVVVTLRDSPTADVQPLAQPTGESNALILWNRAILPSLQRERVDRGNGQQYFRVPYSLPVLELSPSQAVQWNGTSALLQGRVYGFAFDNNPPQYETWYSSVAGWIRSSFSKNPTDLDGYVGPVALEWFRQGGTLLPMFEPPLTPEWQSFFDRQRTVRSTA